MVALAFPEMRNVRHDVFLYMENERYAPTQ